MKTAQLDELLYTLDLCADTLPFDLQTVHVRRLQIIRGILKEREKVHSAPARIFSLVERKGRNDDDRQR